MSRFEPIQFCANIEQYKVTVALVVPPILVVLARHPGTLYAILNTKSNTHWFFSGRQIRFIERKNHLLWRSSLGRCFDKTGNLVTSSSFGRH